MAELSEPQTMRSWRVSTLANPTAFMRLSGKLLPWLIAITLILFAVGLTMAFRAPPDYQQGETVKIMYVHVPAAWLSMACYSVIALSSAGYLIWRHPLADVSAKAAAPIGAVFTLACACDGIALGQADVGRLLGLGRAADIRPYPVLPLSRADRLAAGDR